MREGDKTLLKKELCARIPYSLKVQITTNKKISSLISVDINGNVVTEDGEYPIENIKPYLRSLVNMTDDEDEEFTDMVFSITNNSKFSDFRVMYDWIYSHHFDINSLIEKYIAIEVDEDSNVY